MHRSEGGIVAFARRESDNSTARDRERPLLMSRPIYRDAKLNQSQRLHWICNCFSREERT